jgi:hypothetical protein
MSLHVTRLRTAVAMLTLAAAPAGAQRIVVAHDVNTLSTQRAGPQEERFAVNVARFLTAGHARRNLLLFESDPYNPADPTRDYAPGVVSALAGAGFNVAVTTDYSTPFAAYDAVFVAQDFPVLGALDNAALIAYVGGGGSVYLAGGVGMLDVYGPNGAPLEAANWNTFLAHFGLAFDPFFYNGLTSVAITSGHPIFDGVSTLGSEFGSQIIDLGTNPNASIVQSVFGSGVYAVVTTPEPASCALLASGATLLLGAARRLRHPGPARRPASSTSAPRAGPHVA